MKLEFLDGSHIEVLSVFGGPRLIDGVMRDTFRIEVSPETVSFENLKKHFKDNPKTRRLYTYTGEESHLIKNEIGEGYQIFISISDEERKVSAIPGKMIPDKFEEVYVVTIAQMTYYEYQLSYPIADNETSPPTKEE